jgi:hypothetical protein
MGVAAERKPLCHFYGKPTSLAVRTFLGRTISLSEARLRYFICDKGSQVWCDEFKGWCHKRKIRRRFGAVHQHGSLAVVERFIWTLKNEGTRKFLVSARREAIRHELKLLINWYNEHRPHSALDGCTPNELYHGLLSANRRPPCDPRSRWPRKSRCAKLQTLAAGQPGTDFTLKIDFVAGRRHLPIVTLKRVA